MASTPGEQRLRCSSDLGAKLDPFAVPLGSPDVSAHELGDREVARPGELDQTIIRAEAVAP
jgi:hypothetical protein